MSGGDSTVKYWDLSLLGNGEEVSMVVVVNGEQGLPLVRSFLGHSVCFVLLSSRNVD